MKRLTTVEQEKVMREAVKTLLTKIAEMVDTAPAIKISFSYIVTDEKGNTDGAGFSAGVDFMSSELDVDGSKECEDLVKTALDPAHEISAKIVGAENARIRSQMENDLRKVGMTLEEARANPLEFLFRSMAQSEKNQDEQVPPEFRDALNNLDFSDL